MPLKEVWSPAHGRMVKMGRKRPAHPPRRLFRHYRTAAALPAPPIMTDWADASDSTALTNIYKNDVLGCCVISMGWHLLGAWSGNAGNLIIATDQQIINDYGYIGGYVPGDPSTDNGCDEVTALNWWQKNGFSGVAGSNLAGWMGVDATNQTELMQCVWLFENVLFGVELPDAWITPFPSNDGFTWDVAGPPDPNNGHAFPAIGYTAQGLLIDTWGLIGTLTWAACAKYMVTSAGGEAYTAISREMLSAAQQTSPDGLDWPTLISDFDAAGGNVPLPTPGPAPTPGPIPSGWIAVPATAGWFDPASGKFHVPQGWNLSSEPKGQPTTIRPGRHLCIVSQDWKIV